MSSIESHLSNKPKQVFFNPINIFDTFTHSITLLYIFNILFSFNVNFLIYRFTEARTLSVKMASLYQLASQQLSQQPHYDYGLRAIISVLLMAGGNKRANPDLGEDVILIRAMRDSNVCFFSKKEKMFKKKI